MQTVKNRHALRTRQSHQGFTLVELLVVLAIIALLAGLVGPRVINQLGGAKSKTALVQIRDLEQGLEMFKLDVGRYPTTGEGLEALMQQPSSAAGWNGPYMKSEIPLDPWKRPYEYRSPGQRGEIDIFTHGADGTPGGEGENADIGNWR